MKSTDFMRSVFCMCYSKNSIYENWRKNPLIHKNPFAYCNLTIRILQVNYSHSFPFSFQTGKNGLRRYSERGVFYQIYTLILLIGNSPFISYSKSILHW